MSLCTLHRLDRQATPRLGAMGVESCGEGRIGLDRADELGNDPSRRCLAHQMDVFVERTAVGSRADVRLASRPAHDLCWQQTLPYPADG